LAASNGAKQYDAEKPASPEEDGLNFRAIGCSIRGVSSAVWLLLAATELSFWHIQTSGPAKEAVEAAVGRFEQRHPGVTVKATPYENDAFKLKLRAAMGADEPPDVFHTWGGGPLKTLVDAGKVLDLTGRFEASWRSTIVESVLSFCIFDGKVYAVPADIGVALFWYNTKIFEANGLKPPANYSEFMDVVKKLKAGGVIPISLGMKDAWPGAFYFVYLSNRLGGSGPFVNAAEGRGSFEAPCFVEAGRKVAELAALDVFPRDFLSIGYDESRKLFFEEKAAMILMGTWIIAHARKEKPEFLEKMDCFPFPVVEGGEGDPSVVVGGTNTAYAIASTCKHIDLAVELVKELTSEEFAAEWVKKAGRIPAIKGAVKEDEVPPQTFKAFQILSSASAIQLYYDQYLPPELGERHKETTKLLFARRMTPEDAAARMEATAKEIRSRQSRRAADTAAERSAGPRPVEPEPETTRSVSFWLLTVAVLAALILLIKTILKRNGPTEHP